MDKSSYFCSMLKLRFILRKEFLVLFRDLPGLIILFLMPVLLIFVVTLAQENALKSQNSKTQILFVHESMTPFSEKLFESLDSSGFFHPIDKINQLPVTFAEAKTLIGKGDFKFGVIITSIPEVVLLIDPTLQASYKNPVINSLNFIIKSTQAKEVMHDILSNLPANTRPVIQSMVAEKMQKLPPIKETYALREKSAIQPNVIQNNVPGFILFAMFFIVIPMAGSLITEKNEGSFQRLRSLPVPIAIILSGKVLAYLAVCLIQFLLMLTIGIWVFPTCFGLPQLQIGHQYLAIALATMASSMAAVGFGIIVGTAASTHNQAALFGSVMVVLLGVISGTFLPIHLMPEFIQYVSYLSPIRWGIDNYLNLFIREGNIVSIMPKTILLILFFGFAMITSIAIFARQK